jgi:tetratricopeptide (TPR) repeat protein
MKNIENQEPRSTSHKISSIRKYLYKKQLDFFDFLTRDPHKALELCRDTLDYVDQILQLYPNDDYIQSVKGYLHKDEAQALLKLGSQKTEIRKALDKAEQVFNNILVERPNDEAAWNGKGNVEALLGNHKEAIVYYSKAISINPNYSPAIHDRDLSLASLPLQTIRIGPSPGRESTYFDELEKLRLQLKEQLTELSNLTVKENIHKLSYSLIPEELKSDITEVERRISIIKKRIEQVEKQLE